MAITAFLQPGSRSQLQMGTTRFPFLSLETLITTQSVYGADGNDVVSIGAVGEMRALQSASARSRFKNAGTGALAPSCNVGGSATYSTSTAYLITASVSRQLLSPSPLLLPPKRLSSK